MLINLPVLAGCQTDNNYIPKCIFNQCIDEIVYIMKIRKSNYQVEFCGASQGSKKEVVMP